MATKNLTEDYSVACRGVEVAGRTFDRKVEGSSLDRNIIGCRQKGRPDIKWLSTPSRAVRVPDTRYPYPSCGVG